MITLSLHCSNSDKWAIHKFTIKKKHTNQLNPKMKLLSNRENNEDFEKNKKKQNIFKTKEMHCPFNLSNSNELWSGILWMDGGGCDQSILLWQGLLYIIVRWFVASLADCIGNVGQFNMPFNTSLKRCYCILPAQHSNSVPIQMFSLQLFLYFS